MRRLVLLCDLPPPHPVELLARQLRRVRLVERGLQVGQHVAADSRRGARLYGLLGVQCVGDMKVVMQAQVFAFAAREEEAAFDEAPLVEGPSEEPDGPSVG